MDDADLVALREEVEHGVEDREELVDGHPVAAALHELGERHPFEELHDEERLAERALPVVDDLDARRMIDAVRDATLSEEALVHLAVARELAVQDLDRGVRPVVLVGRREHRAHAADAEDAIDPPLGVQIGADAQRGLLRRAATRRRALRRGRGLWILIFFVAHVRKDPGTPNLSDALVREERKRLAGRVYLARMHWA
ncbi:MAG: hypothetical protein U0414_32280 [Polyangiaceae bacterium]